MYNEGSDDSENIIPEMDTPESPGDEIKFHNPHHVKYLSKAQQEYLKKMQNAER